MDGIYKKEVDEALKKATLGKYCIIFLKSTEQTAIYEGTALKMAVSIEGLIVDVTESYIYVSDGNSDVIEKIIPLESIGYIDVDPELDTESVAGLLGEGKGEDDGQRH